MAKQLRIISVGRIKEKYLADGIAEYANRLNSFVSLDFTEVPDESIPDNIPQSAAEKITERALNNKEQTSFTNKMTKRKDDKGIITDNCMRPEEF